MGHCKEKLPAWRHQIYQWPSKKQAPKASQEQKQETQARNFSGC